MLLLKLSSRAFDESDADDYSSLESPLNCQHCNPDHCTLSFVHPPKFLSLNLESRSYGQPIFGSTATRLRLEGDPFGPDSNLHIHRPFVLPLRNAQPHTPRPFNIEHVSSSAPRHWSRLTSTTMGQRNVVKAVVHSQTLSSTGIKIELTTRAASQPRKEERAEDVKCS